VILSTPIEISHAWPKHGSSSSGCCFAISAAAAARVPLVFHFIIIRSIIAFFRDATNLSDTSAAHPYTQTCEEEEEKSCRGIGTLARHSLSNPSVWSSDQSPAGELQFLLRPSEKAGCVLCRVAAGSPPVVRVAGEASLLRDVIYLDAGVVYLAGAPPPRQHLALGPDPLAVVPARDHHPELKRTRRRLARAPRRAVVARHELPVGRPGLFFKIIPQPILFFFSI
jgi:hypothetical protein